MGGWGCWERLRCGLGGQSEPGSRLELGVALTCRSKAAFLGAEGGQGAGGVGRSVASNSPLPL